MTDGCSFLIRVSLPRVIHFLPVFLLCTHCSVSLFALRCRCLWLASFRMPSLLLSILLLAASATQAFASCAHGTSIHPRAEGASGAIKINKFGYTGAIVSLS